MSVLSLASTCTVTSLAISRSQAEADWFIMYTAPAVRQARKHMMVMTSVRERPVTEPAGTIGPVVWVGSPRFERERDVFSPASILGGGLVPVPEVSGVE